MNKKVNTILFILGATLFNVIVALAAFFLLFILYINYLAELLPESGRGLGLVIIFIASIVCSFFTYRVVLKLILAKIDVDKYFDPLFVRQNLKKKDS